jgi:hypothetical protein
MNVQRFRTFFGWRRLRWALLAAAVPVALWACNSHPLESPDPTPETQTDLLYEVNPLRQLDLVFLVDNSSSMREEQENLRRNFPDFMRELQAIPGGLPDTRIGVISSNFGAGPTMPAPECSRFGDRGVFQVKAGCGLDVATSRWLSIDAMGVPNFQGDLPTVFGCLASLGTNGCGYEHQLQSLRAAFAENVAPENKGFLRPSAYLGIVILSDEDDCSGEPESLLYRDQVPGQAGSVRCSLKGHTCNGQPVPAMAGFQAPLTSCEPVVHNKTEADKQNLLINVDEFVQYVKLLKGNRPDKILVSGVIGWDLTPNTQNTDPTAMYGITQRPSLQNPMETEIDTAPICSAMATGSAAPGIRLHKFITSFENNSVHVICQENLRDAMSEIGMKLANLVANTCITARLVDTDGNANNNVPVPQADCQVVDRVPRNNTPTGFLDIPLPHCSANRMPCWELQEDLNCGSGFKTIVRRAPDQPAEPDTLQSIRCLTCTEGSGDPRCVSRRMP